MRGWGRRCTTSFMTMVEVSRVTPGELGQAKVIESLVIREVARGDPHEVVRVAEEPSCFDDVRDVGQRRVEFVELVEVADGRESEDFDPYPIASASMSAW